MLSIFLGFFLLSVACVLGPGFTVAMWWLWSEEVDAGEDSDLSGGASIGAGITWIAVILGLSGLLILGVI
jgi:hypothetical protein